MKNFVVLGMVVLLSTFHGFGQKLINTQPHKKAIAEAIPDFVLAKQQDLKYGLCLEVRPTFVSEIYEKEPHTISISIPGWPLLVLQKVNIFSPDFVVKTSDNKTYSGKTVSRLRIGTRRVFITLSSDFACTSLTSPQPLSRGEGLKNQ
jgi:hypothetical protein